MLHLVDDRLRKWAEDALSSLPQAPRVTTDPPAKAQSGAVVSLYLLELVNETRLARSTRPSPQPALRYLVTVSGPTELAHQALGLLLWSAYNLKQAWRSQAIRQLPDSEQIGDLLLRAPYAPELELEPVPSRIWSAFSIPPQPSFMLRVPIPYEWLERPSPYVTQQAAVQIHPALITLHGRILQVVEIPPQPDGTTTQTLPLAGVSVELPAPYRQVYSDKDGRFAIPQVLATDDDAYRLNLTLSSGLILPLVELSGAGTPEQPVEIVTTLLHGQLFDVAANQPLAGAQVELALPPRVRDYYRDRARRALGIDPAVVDDQVEGLEAQIEALIPDYLKPYRLVVSDANGRFAIPGVLTQPAQKTLRIRSNGRWATAVLDGGGARERPVPVTVRLTT